MYSEMLLPSLVQKCSVCGQNGAVARHLTNLTNILPLPQRFLRNLHWDQSEQFQTLHC